MKYPYKKDTYKYKSYCEQSIRDLLIILNQKTGIKISSIDVGIKNNIVNNIKINEVSVENK